MIHPDKRLVPEIEELPEIGMHFISLELLKVVKASLEGLGKANSNPYR